MFGIRTVLMGVDLLSSDREVRRHALRDSVLVHGSDTISAARAGYTKALAAARGHDRDRDLGGQRGAGADREP